MKKYILAFIVSVVHFAAAAQEMKVTSGTLQHFENFKSDFVEPRNIDVWLPDGYSAKKKYAVLYMHDGQMLFDASKTWNKQAWEVDSIAGKLIGEKQTRGFIVVGISSISKVRHNNYFPQKPFESLPQKTQDSLYANSKRGNSKLFDKVNSDNYLKFIVSELKPFIDKTFSTKKDAANTFIAGSSMGGLISMYAICEYPKVFGGAACLSTHWIGIFTDKNNPIPDAFIKYLKANLPGPGKHKLYFDYGTATLDAFYKPYQLRVDEVMKAKGYTSKNWLTKEFAGEDHSEKSWKNRLSIPLLFLLK